MGLTTYPASGGAVWGDIIGTVADQTDLTTAFGTQGIKRYLALLTQTGTDTPVATVLENSLGGTLVWTRSGVGTYDATLAGVFLANKVFAPGFVIEAGGGALFSFSRTSNNVMAMFSGAGDGVLASTPVEILVYP